jgi:hypothetical protein
VFIMVILNARVTLLILFHSEHCTAPKEAYYYHDCANRLLVEPKVLNEPKRNGGLKYFAHY